MIRKTLLVNHPPLTPHNVLKSLPMKVKIAVLTNEFQAIHGAQRCWFTNTTKCSKYLIANCLAGLLAFHPLLMGLIRGRCGVSS